MRNIKYSIQIFLAPISWSVILIIFMILGKLFPGFGHPSGVVMGIIYAFLLAPFIGIAGIIYTVKIYNSLNNTKTYLAITMNVSLILSGTLVWLTWYGLI